MDESLHRGARDEAGTGAARRIRVVIVDDHAMVAMGLAQLVGAEPDLEVVGVADSVASSIELVGRARPNVVVMDFHLPDGDGAQATAAITASFPEVAVIVLTGSGGHEILARAIEAGCAGFLLKDLDSDRLVMAIRAVARGEVAIHAETLRRTLPLLRGEVAPRHNLTERELEVLRLLARGTTTRELAAELMLARNTIRNHITSVLTKLGAHSRLEAVALAMREGLIDPPVG